MLRATGVAALLLAAAFAGCVGDEPELAASSVALGRIQGTVTDAALNPLAGAEVRLDGTDRAATTDASGAFAFEVPEGEYLALAAAEGYRGSAQRALARAGEPASLAFVLALVPTQTPSVEVSEGKGLLSCRALLVRGAERHEAVCAASDPNERAALAFPIPSEGLAGVVVELAWEPSSAGAKRLHLAVKAAGEDGVELGAAEGEGHASLTLPARVLEAALAETGELVVSVSPAGSFTDDEAGVDAGLAFQQGFSVYVSVFRHAPPPGGYRVASE